MSMARELEVRGLMNVQFAVKDEEVYVLEANPRASRTVPFVSKAIGKPLAKIAARVMAGQTLKELNFTREILPKHYSVKEAVFPFIKFPGVDVTLGPEMRSTGEVMGIDADLGIAYAKAQMSAQPALPTGGNAFISVKDSDKAAVVPIAMDFANLGFTIYATGGTARVLGGCRHPGQASLQAARGPSKHSGSHQERRDAFHHQHAQRTTTPQRRGHYSQRSCRRPRRDDDHPARRAGEQCRHSSALKSAGYGVKSSAGISRRLAPAAQDSTRNEARTTASSASSISRLVTDLRRLLKSEARLTTT